MKLFNLIPIEYRAGAAAAGVLLAIAGLFGLYNWGHADGYQKATLEWTVKYQKREAELEHQLITEVDRQATANAEAKADEEAAIEDYRLKLEAANKLALQLADEAAKDPAAENIALDAEAVARHNRRID
jgi:hypothetical protein